MKRLALTIITLALVGGGCGNSNEPTATTTAGLPTPPEDVGALRNAEEAARAQVELGGLRADLEYVVADSFLSPSNTCAAVIFIVDPGQGERITATAYMVLTVGRPAVEIFPRAEQMQPAYLQQWDEVVGGTEWGLLAMAPPETDVEDVSTVCGGPFLDEALRRFVAVQIEPE